MPRPKLEIDWKIVDNIFKVGGTITMCASILEIAHDTLERRIKSEKKMSPKEYRNSRMDKTRVKLQQKAIDLAINKDNVTMLIFCLKNLCDWSDKSVDAKELVNEIKLAYNLEDKGDDMGYGKGTKKDGKKGGKKGTKSK